MIKDILVNLETGSARDAARDYAISAAGLFEAHLTGVAFAYDPVNPGSIINGIGAAIIAEYRDELRVAAQAARDKFKGAAQEAGLLSEAHVLELGRAGVAATFGAMARNYDLSIIGQARPDSEIAGRCHHRERAVRLGPAGVGRALYPEDRHQA